LKHPGSVVVVGGGIIGVCGAWYLQRAGWQVTVLDRQTIGGACSHGNCGLVCPSHVLPLTEPGAFKAALKALLSADSPFRIQPRLDPRLWSWLWNFSRRCNHDAMVCAAHAIQALLVSAMSEYQKLVFQERVECEWQAKGLLFVYQQAAELDRYDATNQLLADLFHEPAQKLSASQTVALEPALKESIAGGWYYAHDAHLRPDLLLRSLRHQLEAVGVEFVEQCELLDVLGSGRAAHKVLTTRGEYAADAFLFACGAWSPQLKQHVGCTIPIEPGKGYSITMPRPSKCPQIPLIFPEHRVAVTPMVSGYRLGSIMEFVGYDESIRPERLQLLRRGAAQYLQEPYCQPEISSWYGWRPMTYDSLPIIDRTPRWNNGWLATGHNMLGLSMAPATGKLIAELIDGEDPHLDPTPYQLARFGGSHAR
jgi:D-amino-acid dehydrogenase